MNLLLIVYRVCIRDFSASIGVGRVGKDLYRWSLAMHSTESSSRSEFDRSEGVVERVFDSLRDALAERRGALLEELHSLRAEAGRLLSCCTLHDDTFATRVHIFE